jgi:hypothetical protein
MLVSALAIAGCRLDASGLLDVAGDAASSSANSNPSLPSDDAFDIDVAGESDSAGGADGAAGGDSALGTDAVVDDAAVDEEAVDGATDDATVGPVTGDDTSSEAPSEDQSPAPQADAPQADVCGSTENCTDGIDNNCDGLTDCQDPLCVQSGYSCVDPAPVGWSFIAFTAASQPACPSELPQSALVDVDVTAAPAQCSCTCTLDSPPACTGMFLVTIGDQGACGTYAADGPADGTCIGAGTVLPYAQVWPPAGASAGACKANPVTTKPDAKATRGQICSGEETFGAGCVGGQVCARVPSPFLTCVAKAGQQVCPSGGGYSTLHFAGVLSDTRGCTPCACESPPKCGIAWDLFNNPNCAGNPKVTLHPTDTCGPTNTPTEKFSSTRLTASASDASCAPPAQQPQPTGAIQLDQAQTVCCR